MGRPARVARRRRRHPRRGRRLDAVAGRRPGLGRRSPRSSSSSAPPRRAAPAPVVTDLHRARATPGVRAARRHPRPADHLHRRRGHRRRAARHGPRPAPRRRAARHRARPSPTSSPPAAAPAPRSRATRPRPPGPRRPGRCTPTTSSPSAPSSATSRARGALVARIVAAARRQPRRHPARDGGGLARRRPGRRGRRRARLIVHANTVRYRLAGITKAIGYDLTDAHDAHTVRTALALHRLGPVARATTAPVIRARFGGTLQIGRPRFVPYRHGSATAAASGWTRDRHRLPRPGLPDPGLPQPVARAARPA